MSIDLEPGLVAVVGPNGAGKTSLLSALAGIVPAGGTIELDGTRIDGLSPERRAAAGLAFVPDGRRLFGRLSVEQNLIVGTTPLPARAVPEAVESVYARFPLLGERRTQRASTLSGGEGQLLMIARALVASPRVLLIDEPFQGLSAEASALVLDAIRAAATDGTAVAIASPDQLDGVPSIQILHGREVAA